MSAPIVSMAVAHRIWMAHREIAIGEKLMADLRDAIARGEDATPLDGFGRRRPFSLGVPSGSDSQRLFDVAPDLAISVIKQHIANKREELVAASLEAQRDLHGIGMSEAR